IEYFSPLDLPTIAIDLPSGMDANTGFLLNQVLVAEHCLTFQLAKLCHYVTPATNACGQVHVLDIEIWPEVIKQLEIKRYLTDADFVESIQSLREADSHKGRYGHVLLIGGSRDMTGAICLSAEAALRSGAGLVTVVCPSACREVLLTRLPEAMCIGLGSAERQMLSIDDLPEIRARMAGKSALAIGPGMGTAPESLALIEALLDEISLPVVWDADALNLLAKIENWQKRLPKASVLTPHPGEMKRLCQSATVNHHRLESAEALAANCRATILLKGRYSIIASPEGKTYVNPTGNAGMATAGSGDVLTGLIAGKLAQGYSPDHAAILGAYLHGAAGDRAAGRLSQATMLASDILQHLS
ncbi:MAG: NAD(P)H-hydrate dehydratase, partial [Bacteroidota bacterium]